MKRRGGKERTSPCRVLQQLGINVFSGKLDVPDDGAPDKAVLDRHLRAGQGGKRVGRGSVHAQAGRTMWGCLASSRTLMLSKRMLRNLRVDSRIGQTA